MDAGHQLAYYHQIPPGLTLYGSGISLNRGHRKLSDKSRAGNERQYQYSARYNVICVVL